MARNAERPRTRVMAKSCSCILQRMAVGQWKTCACSIVTAVYIVPACIGMSVMRALCSFKYHFTPCGRHHLFSQQTHQYSRNVVLRKEVPTFPLRGMNIHKHTCMRQVPGRWRWHSSLPDMRNEGGTKAEEGAQGQKRNSLKTIGRHLEVNGGRNGRT